VSLAPVTGICVGKLVKKTKNLSRLGVSAVGVLQRRLASVAAGKVTIFFKAGESIKDTLLSCQLFGLLFWTLLEVQPLVIRLRLMATKGYIFVHDEDARCRVKRACNSCQGRKVSDSGGTCLNSCSEGETHSR
jgi:hypothetical protein